MCIFKLEPQTKPTNQSKYPHNQFEKILLSSLTLNTSNLKFFFRKTFYCLSSVLQQISLSDETCIRESNTKGLFAEFANIICYSNSLMANWECLRELQSKFIYCLWLHSLRVSMWSRLGEQFGRNPCGLKIGNYYPMFLFVFLDKFKDITKWPKTLKKFRLLHYIILWLSHGKISQLCPSVLFFLLKQLFILISSLQLSSTIFKCLVN